MHDSHFRWVIPVENLYIYLSTYLSIYITAIRRMDLDTNCGISRVGLSSSEQLNCEDGDVWRWGYRALSHPTLVALWRQPAWPDPGILSGIHITLGVSTLPSRRLLLKLDCTGVGTTCLSGSRHSRWHPHHLWYFRIALTGGFCSSLTTLEWGQPAWVDPGIPGGN